MKLKSSSFVQETAQVVLEHNTLMRESERFEVFEVPSSVRALKAYALLIFRPGLDFEKNRIPKDTMIIPAIVNGRKAYFIDRKVAADYS